MDWWVWVLVVGVVGIVAVGWWWSSARTPDVPEHGHRPGDETQFPRWGI
jgi:hypothetical protein